MFVNMVEAVDNDFAHAVFVLSQAYLSENKKILISCL